MTKPITVAQSELANKIMEDIKNSQLHPCIFMPVIEEIYTISKNVLQETRQKEMDEYQKNMSSDDITDKTD